MNTGNANQVETVINDYSCIIIILFSYALEEIFNFKLLTNHAHESRTYRHYNQHHEKREHATIGEMEWNNSNRFNNLHQN